MTSEKGPGLKYRSRSIGRPRGPAGGLKPRSKRIQPDDKVPLRLSGRERELIADETFAPDYLTNRLRLVPVGEKRPAAAFTLDEWEELHGYVAAAANHCKNRKLEDKLYRICERVQEILDTHTDKED